jgi:hypothetical protein
MLFSGLLHHVALVRTDVSEECITFLIRVKQYIPQKRWFLQQPHNITSQKMAFFIVTTVKTSNLTYLKFIVKGH